MAYTVLTGLAVLLGLISVGVCTTYDRIDQVPGLSWDFIIVGGVNFSLTTFSMGTNTIYERTGGTAGSVLASRLTENPKINALVIEAGPTCVQILSSHFHLKLWL